MKTIYNGSGATVTLYWKIMRGENKVTEDLSNLKSRVFLIGSCNTYSVTPDVVTDEEFGNKVLKVEVDASMLCAGVYDVKAVWEKNDGRNIMKSARTGVFAITDNSEEVDEIKSEEVIRIASYVESIGRDGLSAYEIAVIRGLNNGLSENDWVGNEADRIKAEQERESAETTRKENETARENAESGRQSRFNTFMTESAASFSQAQTNRDTDFTQAQEDREAAFTDKIQDFETRFNEAEANRNDGEAERNTNYEAAENKRDNDYATAEAYRNKKYNQAEEERDSTIQAKLVEIEERYTTAEAARRNLFTEAETERDAKEDDRAAAEDARQSRYNEFMSGIERTYDLSEEARQKAFEENEEKREKNEQIREESEQARIDTFDENERGRIATFNTNEGTYDSYDDSRWGIFNTNEAQRDTQEHQRIIEEEVRRSNEAKRIANEAERQNAEAIRQESYLDKIPTSALVQTTGDSESSVMSQKATTDKLAELESNLGDISSYKSKYLGNFTKQKLSIPILKGNVIYGFADGTEAIILFDESDNKIRVEKSHLPYVVNFDCDYVQSGNDETYILVHGKVYNNEIKLAAVTKELTELASEVGNVAAGSHQPNIVRTLKIGGDYSARMDLAPFYPVEDIQKKIRGVYISGITIDLGNSGVFSVCIGTEVGSSGYSYIVYETFNIKKGGINEIKFQNPLLLEENQSLGLGRPTDTAPFKYAYHTSNEIPFRFLLNGGWATEYSLQMAISTKDIADYLRTKQSNSESDLDIKDDNGKTLVRFAKGHIFTNAFNSENIKKEVNDISKKLSESGSNKNSKIKISILGDSYSTFQGAVHPSTNVSWYPNENNNVKSLNQTWFKLLCDSLDYEVSVNNSYSGTTVCYDSYESGTSDGKYTSFVKRVAELGMDSDFIFVFGGTNDLWSGADLGEYIYSNWDDSNLEFFRPALAYVLFYAKTHYPKAKVVFVKNDIFNEEWSNSILTICKYYNVPVVELGNVSKQQNHPDVEGMVSIKNQVIEKISTL